MIGPLLRRVPRVGARSVRTALCALAFLGASSCGTRAPIRIGLISSFDDPVGLGLRFGAQLAAQEINAAGGINGRLIELVERNDGGNADSALGAALALAQSDVVAVIGAAFSGPTLAAASVFNDPATALTQITPAGSSPAISDAGEWMFRTCPSDLAHAAALARFVRQTLRLERGAVLYMNNNYGRDFKATFEREFQKLGGTVLSSDPYLPADVAQTAPYLDRIARDGRAQFILGSSYEADGIAILRMARARGIDVPFLGGDGIEGIEREGPIAEGSYQTTAYLSNINTPANRAFVEKYRAAFPREALPNQTAIGTYEIVQLLAYVIGEVGTDRRAIRDGVASIGRGRPAFAGVLEPIAFDSVGDVPEKQVLIAQARGGVARALEGAQ